MAWQLLAAALPAAASLAGTYLQKPSRKDYQPQTDYMKKYLSYLRGRSAGKEVLHMAMQPQLRAIGRQGREMQRQVGYDVAKTGLAGSGIEAQMRLSAGAQTQEALSVATSKAVAAQAAEDARIGEKSADLAARIGAEEARSEQAYKMAGRQWTKQMGAGVLKLGASIASAGITQAGQLKQAKTYALRSGLFENMEQIDQLLDVGGYDPSMLMKDVQATQKRIDALLGSGVSAVDIKAVLGMGSGVASWDEYIKKDVSDVPKGDQPPGFLEQAGGIIGGGVVGLIGGAQKLVETLVPGGEPGFLKKKEITTETKVSPFAGAASAEEQKFFTKIRTKYGFKGTIEEIRSGIAELGEEGYENQLMEAEKAGAAEILTAEEKTAAELAAEKDAAFKVAAGKIQKTAGKMSEKNFNTFYPNADWDKYLKTGEITQIETVEKEVVEKTAPEVDETKEAITAINLATSRKDLQLYLESDNEDIVRAAENKLADIGKIEAQGKRERQNLRRQEKEKAEWEARAIAAGLDKDATKDQIIAAEEKAAEEVVEEVDPKEAKLIALREKPVTAIYQNKAYYIYDKSKTNTKVFRYAGIKTEDGKYELKSDDGRSTLTLTLAELNERKKKSEKVKQPPKDIDVAVLQLNKFTWNKKSIKMFNKDIENLNIDEHFQLGAAALQERIATHGKGKVTEDVWKMWKAYGGNYYKKIVSGEWAAPTVPPKQMELFKKHFAFLNQNDFKKLLNIIAAESQFSMAAIGKGYG